MNRTPPSATEIAMIAATLVPQPDARNVARLEINCDTALDIWLQAARVLKARENEVDEIFYDKTMYQPGGPDGTAA